MKPFGVVILSVLLAGCSGPDTKGAARADTMTQRQLQDAVARSKIPGAKGVQRALRAADDAAARDSAMELPQ
jgi:hypothetical protein